MPETRTPATVRPVGLFGRLTGAFSHVARDTDAALRVAVLVIVSAAAVVLYGAWSITHFGYGVPEVGTAYLVFVALNVGLLLKLRRDRAVAFASHATLALLIGAAAFSTAVTGGLRGTNVAPFFVLLVASVFLLGRRGYPWAGLCLAIPLAFELATRVGVVFPDVVPPESRANDAFATWASMLATLALFVRAYESVRATAMQRLEEADRAKTRFLANVSHELRAPLHVLTTAHELLPAASTVGERQSLLATASEHVRVMEQLVDDLLDAAALQRGQLTLHPEDFDLAEMLAGLAAVLRVWCAERGLACALTVDAAVPARVHGDAARLRQVLLNLAANALKFTERGTVSVAVSVPDPERPLTCRFSVQDTGAGIPVEEQGRVFDDFYRVERSPTRATRGVGLGLGIVAALARQMGGEVQLDSAPGVGSTFAFTVPFAPPAAPAPAPAASTSAPLRVLVVDDDPSGLTLLGRLVGTLGHDVVTAANGEEALRVWRERAPDLVLLDLQMPVFDGLETARRLRRSEHELARPRTPIVGMSGQVGDDEDRRCRDAGMDALLRKPFRLAALRDAIASARA